MNFLKIFYKILNILLQKYFKTISKFQINFFCKKKVKKMQVLESNAIQLGYIFGLKNN